MPSHALYEQLCRTLPVRAALEQLREARRAAETLQLDVWTLAVEMADLLGLGCTQTQLRLRVIAPFVEHAEDVTLSSDEARRFQPEGPLTLGAQTCFVLTAAGVEFLEAAEEPSKNGSGRRNGHRARNGVPARRQVPVWNSETRELKAGKRVVKRFTRPAPMLERILAAFEEDEWPPHLDDPLTPENGTVPEERLRSTVRRLNHCQKPLLVRFESDGTGAGIRWSWAEKGPGEDTDETRMRHGGGKGKLANSDSVQLMTESLSGKPYSP